MKRVYFFIFSLLLISGLLGDGLAADTRLALLQYRVESAAYGSELSFRKDVEALVERAVQEGAEILVFPEYTNVFLASIPLSASLQEAESLADAQALLVRRYGRTTQIRDFFIARSREVRRIMDGVWGGLAEEYGVWIAAGTAFTSEEDPAGEIRLHNRLYVYGPSGEAVYTQDKVFLTPFERDVLELDAGNVRSAMVVDLGDLGVAFSICRDTFFEVWEEKFQEADLWIDLKANGAVFDRKAEQIFETALPERIANSRIPAGATVCLTGEFLELFWEGSSSVIAPADTQQGYRTVLKSETADEEEILYVDLPFHEKLDEN